MSVAIAGARLGSDNRLLLGCVVGSFLLHVLVVAFAPRGVPHQEPPPRLTATLRPPEPPPAPPLAPAPPAPPVPKPLPPEPAKPEPRKPAPPPTKPEARREPPLAEKPRVEAPPSVPLTAAAPAPAAPAIAVPVAPPAPAPAPPEARPEPRAERPAPVSAVPATSPAQAGELSDRELVALFQNQIAGIVETRKLKRYPSEAMQNGWEGASTVLLRIGTDGKVAGVETATSSGHDMLDEQARISISRAKPFVQIPEGLKGKPFEARVRVVFSLKN